MISAIEHVALSVADLDRSLAFYRNLLGFTLERLIDAPPARWSSSSTARHPAGRPRGRLQPAL